METVKSLFGVKKERRPCYEPLFSSQQEVDEILSPACLCDNCRNLPEKHSVIPGAVRHITAHLVIASLAITLWIALMGFSLQNAHLQQNQPGSKNLASEIPLVPTDFESNYRFINADPNDTPFWGHSHNESDSVDANAWNYYGSNWIWLKKGSKYEIPGGRPLIPLYEEDAWMKDYLGYISAYQHQTHCLGVIKHVLMAYKDGKSISAAEIVHANTHCLEVLRHGVMCHADLTLAVPEVNAEGEEHEPYFGGEKHMCHDQKQVHDLLASRNLGFKWVHENGEEILKAWAWPLPTTNAGNRW